MKHVMQNRIHLFSLPSVGPGPTATPPAPPIHSSLLSVLLRQCFNVVSVFLFRTHSHNCRRTVSHRRTSHSPPTNLFTGSPIFFSQNEHGTDTIHRSWMRPGNPILWNSECDWCIIRCTIGLYHFLCT